MIFIGIINIIQLISYIPQIFRLIKIGKSDELIVVTWVLWNISSLCWLVYELLYTQDFWSIVTYGIGLILNLIVLVLILSFRNQKFLNKDT